MSAKANPSFNSTSAESSRSQRAIGSGRSWPKRSSLPDRGSTVWPVLPLDVLAVGPIVTKTATVFDEYWNSASVFEVDIFTAHQIGICGVAGVVGAPQCQNDAAQAGVTERVEPVLPGAGVDKPFALIGHHWRDHIDKLTSFVCLTK